MFKICIHNFVKLEKSRIESDGTTAVTKSALFGAIAQNAERLQTGSFTDTNKERAHYDRITFM